MKLLTATRNQEIDDALGRFIRRCETMLPGRVRAYYLGGSYSDGTATGHRRSPNASDLDLHLIVRGTSSADEAAAFEQLVAAEQSRSPVALDAHVHAEDDLLRPPGPESSQLSFLNALIKGGGVLLYGDDPRAGLPDVPFARYVLDVIESGVFHLGIPRQKQSLAYPLVDPLVLPLAYPDPNGAFYGYDRVPSRLDAPPGTRVLVSIATWMATLRLALETGRYAVQKSQCIQRCDAFLPRDDETQLVAALYAACKSEWAYRVPEGAEERAQLRSWCHDLLAVENTYLARCRTFLLDRLQHGTEGERRQALRVLWSVAYRDDALRASLGALARSDDMAMRADASRALDIVSR